MDSDKYDGDGVESQDWRSAGNEEERLLLIAEAFLADLQRGRAVDPVSYVARYPELSERLLPRLKLALAMFLAGRKDFEPTEQDRPPSTFTGGELHETILSPQASQSPAAPAPPLRQSLGRFTLLELVGQGAFGAVYRAHDPQLDRIVAVKVPRVSELVEATDIERFLREARSTAQLRHPSIVSIFEVVPDERRPYIVSDFIEGKTLATVLTEQIIAPQPGARIVAELASALQYAHERGVIHRDIKPANIMLAGGPAEIQELTARPMVMDFGLAKRDAVDPQMTVEGTVLGTPAYMSPEQARGDSSDVDGRTDVYSLGVVLYQLLTGEVPFRGTLRRILQQTLEEDPRPPRQLNESIPRDLETICLKAMAKAPSERYASAAALEAELQRFLRHEPILARPITRVERAWRWARRNPTVAILMSLVLLLVVGTSIGSSIAAVYFNDLAGRESTARGTAVRREGEANDAKQKADNATKKAEGAANRERIAKEDAQERQTELRRELSRQYVKRGSESVAAEDYFGGLYWFVKALELDQGDANREPAHRLRIGMLLDRCPRIVGHFEHDGPVASAEFNHDGSRLVTAGYDRVAKIWDVATGQQIGAALQHDHVVYYACFSPDGNMVATASYDRTARVWDATTGKLLHGPFHHGEQVSHMQFSPDSKRIVTSIHNPRFFDAPPPGVLFPTEQENPADSSLPGGSIWNLATGERIPLVVGSHQAQFSPDGERVLVLQPGPRQWTIQSAASGETVVGPIKTELPAASAQFSRNGIHVVLRDFRGKLSIINSKTGDAVWTSQAALAAEAISAGSEQADGKPVPPLARELMINEPHLFGPFANHDDAALRFGTVVTSLRAKQRLSPQLAYRPWSRLYPTSKPQLVLQTGHQQAALLWDLSFQASPIPPLMHSQQYDLSYDRAGRRILASDKSGRIFVYDANTGRTLKTLGLGNHGVFAAWSADDREIVATGMDKWFRIWDLETARVKGEPLRLSSVAWGLFVSPDQQTALVSHLPIGEAPYPLYSLFDLSTSKLRTAPFTHGYETYKATFCRDSRSLATFGANGNIPLRDALTGDELGPPLRNSFGTLALAFDPGGKFIVSSGGDRTTQAIDLRTREPFWQLHGNAITTSLAFDVQGQRLAMGNEGGNTRVVRANTGEPLTPWHQQLGRVDHVSFTPEGRWVVAASRGGVVVVIDSQTGERISPPLQHGAIIDNLAVRPDGRQFATTSTDGTLRLWNLTSEERPLADLQQLLRVLYPFAVDATGALEPIAVDLERAAFREISDKYPREFRSDAVRTNAWRREFAAGSNLSIHPELSWSLLKQAAVDELTGQMVDGVTEPDHDWHRARLVISDQRGQGHRKEEAILAAARAGITEVGLLEAIDRRSRTNAFQVPFAVIDADLEAQPDNRALLLIRAWLNFNCGEAELAIADATHCIAGLPLGHLYVLRGDAYLELADYDRAAADFRLALAQEIRADVCLSGLVAIHVLREDAAGVKEIKKSLQYRAGATTNLYIPLAHVLLPEPPPADQIAVVEKLIRGDDKEKYIVHVTYGGLLARAGRHAEAQQHLQAWVKKQAHNPYGWLHLALAQIGLKQYDEARASYALAQAALLPSKPYLDRTKKRAYDLKQSINRQDLMHWQLLSREIERVLAKSPPPKVPPPAAETDPDAKANAGDQP